uniref:Putative ovule protein n=1 Tax=Solanum chacoense TaxID=4108 RepID=A0A0V0H088_SOLCH
MLEGLSEKAKQRFIKFRKKDLTVCPKESPSKWPTNMLAANCMYGICQTLLVSSDIIEFENSKIMFDKLSTMITDITGACLTNLQRAMQCHHGTIKERLKGVRSAILLLGKAENILEILRSQPLPSSAPDQLAKIDHWCTISKGDYLSCGSSLTSNCTPTSQSSFDLYLAVD